MFNNFIHFVLNQAIYEKGETGVIIAHVPGYQGFYSQGDSFEEARENLQDAIEGVIMRKFLLSKDELITQKIQEFILNRNENLGKRFELRFS